MKKSISLLFVLVFSLSLSGCAQSSAPIGKKLVIEEFSRNVNISMGDLSYDCLVDYIDGNVTVTAQSSSASGLIMAYNGSELSFEYEDMSLSYPGRNTDIINPAVLVYEVIVAVNSDQVTAVPFENGMKASGQVTYGFFTAAFDKNYTISEIELKNANIYIKFKAPN